LASILFSGAASNLIKLHFKESSKIDVFAVLQSHAKTVTVGRCFLNRYA